MNYKAIGYSIAEGRTKAGLSIQDLSERLSVDIRTIESWERGHNIPDENIIGELSRNIGKTPEEIMTSDIVKENGTLKISNEYVLDERYIRHFNRKYAPISKALTVRDFFEPYKMLNIYNKEKKENNFTSIYVDKTKIKKHTKEDFKEVFTKRDGRAENIEIKAPWLFTRFFIFIVILIAAAFIAGLNTAGIVLSVVLFPISILLYLTETNYPRNIKLSKLLGITIIGGALSVLFVLVIREFTGYGTGLFGNVLTGVIEEGAKIFVAFLFIRKMQPKYILSGMLIGAAVGTGFAIIETFMYVYNPEELGDSFKVVTALLRGLLSIGGGHIFWTGITAGALTFIIGNNKAEFSDLLNTNFLKILFIVILLHAAWNLFSNLIVSVIICIIGLRLIRKQLNTGILQYDIALKLNKNLYKKDENDEKDDKPKTHSDLFFTIEK